MLVGAVVLVNVFFGGMRSITFVQAFQYWLKLTALLVPVMFLLLVWAGDGAAVARLGGAWASPLVSADAHPLYTTYSLIVATFLGTMGLPHVVVRFYTNPDGRTARRTTLVVLALLGLFYLLPPVYGALGRLYAPDLVAAGATDTVVLELPARMVGGLGGELLVGADRGRRVRGVPVDVVGADHRGRRGDQPGRAGPTLPRRARVPGGGGRRGRRTPRARGLRRGRRRRAGGRAGVRGGRLDVLPAAGARHLVAAADRRRRGRRDAGRRRPVRRRPSCSPCSTPPRPGWPGALLSQPAAWTVPVAFATMVVVSLLTPVPAAARTSSRTMVRLHTPEAVALDRGPQPL